MNNNDKKNETQIPIESEFNKVNIFDKNPNPSHNHENCYKPQYEKLWCNKCVPCCIIEGWTSENSDIDKFIKETIYNARYHKHYRYSGYDSSDYGDDHRDVDYSDGNDYIYDCSGDADYPLFLEWVPFERFENIKQIGEGGFAKVYSATWIDGRAKYDKQDDGSWKKEESNPMKVAIKRLNGSQNISIEYINKLKTYWNLRSDALKFYGMTKDPETKEFMLIIKFSKGNLKTILLNDFNKILWEDKINYLFKLSNVLKELHDLEFFHKNFHSGNILQEYYEDDDEDDDEYDKDHIFYISDFGLSGPSYKQKVDDKVCGVLPYIAPEVLNREPYALSSDIYSFGVIMAEISSGKPPFCNRKHDINLALEICNGLRPELGKGTPEIYKKLAHRCMNAIPNQRPTATELTKILAFWFNSHDNTFKKKVKEKFGYQRKEIKAIFDVADKEIPNISTSYEKNPDAIYTSRVFTFSNLSKPINSHVITSYLNDKGSNKVNNHHGDCYNPPYTLWCRECVPHCIIEGWTSENHIIDVFIMDTIYNAKYNISDDENDENDKYPLFLEWVPFDRFKDIKPIGEGGFSKVYSAIWINGKAKYERQDDGSWEKRESEPIKVALKKLNESQNISAEYLNELKIHWKYNERLNNICLKFYGMTKDPKTKELIMIIEFSEKGNLRSFLLDDFNSTLWIDKILSLYKLSYDLYNLHKLGYCHKDFHSGNILQIYNDKLGSKVSYISDFGLSGPSYKQKENDKVCGVLPYIAPEVLNKEQYKMWSDIYSFGIIMTEVSSGKPPFYERKHNVGLALKICNGLRPEFGKGTPEVYKKLAYRCMNAIPDQRLTAKELAETISSWENTEKKEGMIRNFYAEEVRVDFEEADKEIPKISISYEKNSDAIYTSRLFTFSNLSKPINSSIITSYLNDEGDNNKECQDSQIIDLEVPSSEDECDEDNANE